MKKFLFPSAILLSILFVVASSFIKSNSFYLKQFPKLQHVENNRGDFDNSLYIVIDKSDYELKVYDEEGWYATYPIVFGTKDANDKMYEGDKRTPEGSFRVILKKHHSKWGPELLLDYPNDESYKKFNDRKSKGLIPRGAKIGGGIAIHATRPSEEWTVDNYYNWTDGCISVKYTDMQDLFDYIPVGTVVTIQP